MLSGSTSGEPAHARAGSRARVRPQRLQQLLDREDQQIGVGGGVEPQPERRDQHEPAHPAWEDGGQLGRYHPAEGVAEDMGRGQRQGIEQLVVDERQVVDVVDRLDAA